MVDKWVHCEGEEEVEFSRFSILETAIYSSDWERKALGSALWSVSDISQYPYVKASILGASDKNYYWYYAGDLAPDGFEQIGEEFFLHFCSSTECDDSWIEHEVGKEEYVHCYAWRVVSNATAKKRLKDWGIAPPHSSWFDKAYQVNYRHRASYQAVEGKLSDTCPLPPIQAILAAESTSGKVAAASTKKAAAKAIADAPSEKGGRKRKKKQEVALEKPTKGPKVREDSAAAVLDSELAKLREAIGGRADKAGVESSVVPAGILRKPKHRPSTSRPVVEEEPSAGDAVKDEPPSPSKKQAAEVLAHRASEHAEKRSASKAHGAEEDGKSDPVDTLIKLLKRGTSDEGDELEDSFDTGEQKRMAYRRLAKSSPGILLQRLLRLMREQVTSLSGDSEEDPLSPVAMRFFLQVFLPNHRDMGEPELREIRTLCEALDGLLRGRTLETGDLLAMRLKAAMLAAQEGSWQIARHLELLPPMQKHLPLNQEEETLIRKVEAGEMKLRDLLVKIKKGKQD